MYVKFFKRFFDIIIGIIALPFLLIIVIIISPIIYFDDRGPIFYCGERIGFKGKVFRMYKFRSMIVNAPDIRTADGSTYNADDDPRITRIGRFMRRTSIDEIPQFINVLIGNMSFVGNRPDTPRMLSVYTEYEKKYLFSVKPGITGYSQAYYRNSTDCKTKIKNDIFYAKNVSFMFDVRIFFRTIKTVLLKENINRQQ